MILAALLSLALIVPAPSQQVNTQSGCNAWTSTTNPPPVIRVLTRHRQVIRVPIKRYVLVVMGKEWPGYLPFAVQQAGAVAVKQYAWWKAMHPRRSRYGCFDVHSSTRDQIYNPSRARVKPSHYLAISSTWLTYVVRSGIIPLTGYRRGHPGRCGHDRNGWKLFALSAKRCATNGYSYRAILRLYYDGKVIH